MPILYRSTRGKQNGLRFEDVVLGGLANDKGLFVPEKIPIMTMEEIEKMRGMSYVDMAYTVISRYVGPEDVPADKLKDIVQRSFATFRTPEVTPVVKLSDVWVLELFHGPTFAFKDVALQFLGNLFEYFLTTGSIQDRITILGATSGDTGSAAIHGLRGKKNVNCFIMYPKGKVTEVQERQMTTIPDTNVHCINIDGNFDDCQAIVKAAFADAAFRDEVKLGAINSINWARVLAQITYYFYSWLRVTDANPAKAHISKLNYAVPTGNFGDILAGYYAKRMGLPVDRLVVCANENDVLHRFLQTGVYRKTSATLTIAPSMDISISSNFERYLYYLAGGSAETLASWMDVFESTGEVAIPAKLLEIARGELMSYSSSKQDIIDAMRDVYDKEKYLVCPHTATAVVAAQRLNLRTLRTVLLATAHPAKFEEAMQLALTDGRAIPARPKILNDLFRMRTRTSHLPGTLKDVEAFVRDKLKSPTSGGRSFLSALATLSTIAAAGAAAYYIYLSSTKRAIK
jgi:threonine synthase